VDFLNHKGGNGFLTGFPPFSLTVETVRGCVSLKKEKPQGKPVELTVNTKEENSYYFYLDFGQEFGLTKQINGLHINWKFFKSMLYSIQKIFLPLKLL
jgi:hypothetical protein